MRFIHINLASAVIVAFAASAQDSIVTQSRDLLEKARQESAAAFDAANQSDQAEFEKHTKQSAAYMKQAEAVFESARIETSTNVDELTAYAEFRRETEDFDLAESVMIRAISLDPENASLWLGLGEIQTRLGSDFESRATTSLRKAIDLDESSDINARAHAALGALFLQQGLFDFARKELELAIEEDPNHVGARITLASIEVRDGNISKASESLDALGEIGPQYMALMQRTVEKALVDFDESRRWMADTADNHLAYAKLLVRAGRPAESLLPLERATELDPDNFVTWNLLGSMYRGFDRIEEARKAFTRSLELNGDQPRTRAALEELNASAVPLAPLAPPQ